MITFEQIQSHPKERLSDLIPTLEDADINQLVSWLAEKDDNFRYKCFLLLQSRSKTTADVYPYWELFVEKLSSSNSYQRNIGLNLIAENVRWDTASKFDKIVNLFLSHCDDEKPITVRQCVQGLCKIVPYNKKCHPAIVEKLISIDLMQRKETQRKILLLDILSVLSVINKIQADERIGLYIQHAISQGILDNKTKQMVGLV